MNWDEFVAALKARRPEWFATAEPEKAVNVAPTTKKPPAPDAVADGWDGAEVVESDEPDNWWDV